MSKASTAACTLEHYTAFLLAESQGAGCVRLSEVSGGAFAHDADSMTNRPCASREILGSSRGRWRIGGDHVTLANAPSGGT